MSERPCGATTGGTVAAAPTPAAVCALVWSIAGTMLAMVGAGVWASAI